MQGSAPKLEDGGHTMGAAGWVLTMLWLGVAVLFVLLMRCARAGTLSRGGYIH